MPLRHSETQYSSNIRHSPANGKQPNLSLTACVSEASSGRVKRHSGRLAARPALSAANGCSISMTPTELLIGACHVCLPEKSPQFMIYVNPSINDYSTQRSKPQATRSKYSGSRV